MARIAGAGPLIVIDTDVVGSHRSKPVVERLHVVERGDRHAGVADLAVDVGPLVGIEAVQRHRVERRRQAGGRLPLGQQVEAAVGADGVALAGEHARGVFAFALEGEHPAGEREPSGQVLVAQPPQQVAVVAEAGQRHLGDVGARERLRGEGRADLAVADLGHVLVARVGLDRRRPAVEQGVAGRVERPLGVGQQGLDVVGGGARRRRGGRWSCATPGAGGRPRPGRRSRRGRPGRSRRPRPGSGCGRAGRSSSRRSAPGPRPGRAPRRWPAGRARAGPSRRCW